MRFAAALSTAESPDAVLEELKAELRAAWPKGEPVDLACLFVSHHFRDACEILVAEIYRETRAGFLVGCAGESVICNDREIEDEPAAALWVGRMPGATITPIGLSVSEIALGIELGDWADRFGVLPEDDPSFVLLPEPFTADTTNLILSLNETYPGCPVIGGIPSAGGRGQNRLFFNGEVVEEGLVGLALTGEVGIETVVSQGCRPIGRPFVITRAEANVILELAGTPTIARFQEVFEELPDEDRELVRTGLHVGRVVDEYKEQFQRGDYLIRNVIGADQETGGIAVADRVRVGQTVQFHVRDAQAADEDLRSLLGGAERGAAKAALLFNCNGRGSRMFDIPDHDTALIRETEGAIPVVGFFAAGEIGPVGAENFLHGYTASLAIFRER